MVDTVIPPQGTPGVFDPRNPTLVPNFNQPLVPANSATDPNGTGQGNVSLSAPADYLAAYPRADATGTATVGGTVTAGDILTVEAANPVFPGGFISHSYTVVTGDTLNTIADELADLFNDDDVAATFGLRADVLGSVITFHQNGPVGNFTTLSAPTGEESKITIGGTALTGDQVSVFFNGPNPIAPAEVLAQIGGTIATGDTVELTFTNTSVASFPASVTYTVLAGDTPATIAAGLAALILASSTLSAAGVSAQVTGNGLELYHEGAIGNSTTVSRTVTGSETVTFLPSTGAMAGGTGQPGGIVVTQAVTTLQATSTIASNLSAAINANAAVVAAGISSTPSGSDVDLTVPATAEPMTISTWVNSYPLTATITGAVAAGDVLNLIFTGAGIAGSPVTVSYTALLADTTTSIAAGLAALVNTNPSLQEVGVVASPSTNVISFALGPTIGQMRITESVSPGSETIAITTAPTTTSKLGEIETETIIINDTLASVLATVVSSAPAATDTVALTFTNSGVPSLPVTVTYTLVGADSATTIANGLVALIKASTALQDANITAGNLAGAITITQEGAIGNSTVVSATVTETGGGTETVTFTPSNGHMGGGGGTASGNLSGGSGPIIAANNFTFAVPGTAQTKSFFYGNPYNLGYDVVTAMVDQGMPIV